MEKILLGNEAVALGAFEAGVKVVTAYPGTPSTEITENLAKYDDIDVEWSPNEKVALEVALGAAIGGVRAIVSMKHVGLNVAADPLFTSAYTGINAGLVLVVADDPGMHSSQNEQDSRFYARAAHLPMLEPSDSREARDFVKLAFEISERFDTPVIMRMTTRVAHSRSLVEVGSREEIPIKAYKKDVNKYVMMPAMARGRRTALMERLESLRKYSEQTGINKIELDDSTYGIIASGGAYNYAKEAAPRASFLKLGMIYPLPDNLIKAFSKKVKKLYVIEELETYMEEHIKAMGIPVVGKEIFPKIGELSYEIVARKLLDSGMDTNLVNTSFEQHAQPDTAQPIPVRPPVLCPGCPHRGTFYTLNKLGLTVTGDIGCYTLGALQPLSAMDTCVCMGASIGNAFGMEKALGRKFAKNTVAVIGDSTFIHSGITGLIDVVYNGGTTTVIILDNSTTGMTGHQDNPATGYNAKGDPAAKIDLEALCRAVGVKRVRTCDPLDLADFEKAVQEETAADEPSVIIARRPCVLLKRNREIIPPFKIDSDTCIGCGVCVETGCPAIVNGDTISIDEGMCNGCGLCAGICPTNSISRGGDSND